MLSRLYIENIAVIEAAEIDFSEGFSVLSGETGAGKSIIIDSLNAVFGARVSRDLIRTGQTRACVTAVFGAVPSRAAETLARLGVPCDDAMLVLRRELYADGKNVCRINGELTTLAALRELAPPLINIYGQHDGQNLLNEQTHIDYLDSFAGIEPQLAEYAARYDALLLLNRRIKAMSMSSIEKQKRLETVNAQIDELERAAVRVGEQEELSSLRTELIHAEAITLAFTDALAALNGSDDQNGACGALSQAAARMLGILKYSAAHEGLCARLTEVEILAGELASELSQRLSETDYTPVRLEETELRLDLLSRLSRKHAAVPDELPTLLTSLREERDGLAFLDDNLDELKAQYVERRVEVLELAHALHTLRCEAAERMKLQVESELAQLDMQSARFTAEIESNAHETQVRFGRRGVDTVRFLLSANRGEELRPLAKVASGGELSRIMLALRCVLSGDGAAETAVFDEIDAGVSGRAASRVGEKLLYLSGGRQVLCVTHLPQIAALADQQYRISKSVQGDRTFTSVSLLDDSGRAAELARLTAGINITDATLQSAFDLLRAGKETRKKLLTK